MGDKCKSMRPEHPEWETSVGDKWQTSLKARGPERPEWETSGRQVGDKCKGMRPEHPEWNASPETKAKSCGPGMQPFERSKNPIQVNLFGEKHISQRNNCHGLSFDLAGRLEELHCACPVGPSRCQGPGAPKMSVTGQCFQEKTERVLNLMGI